MNPQTIDASLVHTIVAGVVAMIDRMNGRAIPVELSARHIHLSAEHANQLFGSDLTFDRPLSQPGQFLCKERVRLIGPKGILDNVAILGPSRNRTQVEISLTDARTLGVRAPIRNSGNLPGTPGIILASHQGLVGLDEGVIVAARHIHMPSDYAQQQGIKDRQLVRVRMDCERPLILEDVLVRVADDFRLAMHIDFDEGNACGWEPDKSGHIIAGQREQSHGY
ncbi:MAG: phosphate propanoyltransferase [Desulfoprunum sp.]|nr:phosphate propanoyltransferase [Desulfoprunum sp.]